MEPRSLDPILTTPPPLIEVCGPTASFVLAVLVNGVAVLDTASRELEDNLTTCGSFDQSDSSLALVAGPVRHFSAVQVCNAQSAALAFTTGLQCLRLQLAVYGAFRSIAKTHAHF